MQSAEPAGIQTSQKNSSAAERWAEQVVVLSSGCSSSDPLGPASSCLVGYLEYVGRFEHTDLEPENMESLLFVSVEESVLSLTEDIDLEAAASTEVAAVVGRQRLRKDRSCRSFK